VHVHSYPNPYILYETAEYNDRKQCRISTNQVIFDEESIPNQKTFTLVTGNNHGGPFSREVERCHHARTTHSLHDEHRINNVRRSLTVHHTRATKQAFCATIARKKQTFFNHCVKKITIADLSHYDAVKQVSIF
jgi:hypothetical protein